MSWRPILKVFLHPRRAFEENVRLQNDVTALSQERDRIKNLLEGLDAVQSAPPGHFYSPIHSRSDVEDHLERLKRREMLAPLPAIRMEDQTQLDFLDHLKAFYPKIPFRAAPVDGLLYHFNNDHYSYTDGTILFCAMNYFRPRRIIEIGSGFSTCAILDTNRIFLNSQTQITSIEPHPELLRSLVAKSGDALTIVESKLQDVDLELFDQLGARDILFIDSTHISKVGSDVNCVVFEILPRIKPGVIIHIHDIYVAYEYPDVWLREGRAWNEAYLLRAFLEYNEQFRILLFVSYMQNAYAHEEWFREHMPDTLLRKGGSFWMEKL
jgi:predicted O-methyltransferase YrrM